MSGNQHRDTLDGKRVVIDGELWVWEFHVHDLNDDALVADGGFSSRHGYYTRKRVPVVNKEQP